MAIKAHLARLLGWLWAQNVPPKQIWPPGVEKKIRPYGLLRKSEIPFRNASMIWDPEGYWYLEPMPSEDQLRHYYQSVYWLHFRRGFGAPVNTRDINHAATLTSHIQDLKVRPFRVVNFGAGHGGLSYLLKFAGHDVIEVDPGKSTYMAPGGEVQVVDQLDSIRGSVDLIYASHALEHVRDLEDFVGNVNRLLDTGGYLFLEVPNGLSANCGPQTGSVDVPHTYYFTRQFFREMKNFYTLLNICCDESRQLAPVEDDSGSVIQYLGQKM